MSARMYREFVPRRHLLPDDVVLGAGPCRRGREGASLVREFVHRHHQQPDAGILGERPRR